MYIETYTEQKARHSKEVSNFKGLFFAFSNEQLKEGLAKLGLTIADTKQIVSIGAGGYILKTELQAFKDMLNRQKTERKERLKDEKALLESLVYELNNHEYSYTMDATDALESLGLTIKDIDSKILKTAIKEVMKRS